MRKIITIETVYSSEDLKLIANKEIRKKVFSKHKFLKSLPPGQEFNEDGDIVYEFPNETKEAFLIVTIDQVKEMRELLSMLETDCEMAQSGEWDVSTDEGKESFTNMIDNINAIQKIINL